MFIFSVQLDVIEGAIYAPSFSNNVNVTVDITVGGNDCNFTVDGLDRVADTKQRYLFLQTLGADRRRTIPNIVMEDGDQVNGL